MARISGTAIAIALVLLLGLVVFVPAVTPVRLGYATSDSMQPVLDPGDGYVVVPAGTVEPGEIVVYWSPARQSYVTHRVVAETREGFLTKGDANPRTDQTMGLAPVPRAAIVGEVLAIAGRPVVVPGMGEVVPLLQRYRTLLLGGLLTLLATLVVGRRRRRSSRTGPSVLRVRDVAVPVLLVVLVTVVAVEPLGSATYRLTYLASAEGSGETIPTGERVTRTVSIRTSRVPLATYVVRGEGLEVLNRSFDGDVLHLRLAIPPPDGTGPQRLSLSVHPYPPVLPRDAIVRLHQVSPAVASLASGLAVFLPLYLAYLLLFDGSRPLAVSRSRWLDRLRGG